MILNKELTKLEVIPI